MLFENIAVLNRDFTVSEHQYVAVKDTHIAYVGAQRPQEDYGESYAGAGKLLMSGFVNAHTHTPMTLCAAMPRICRSTGGSTSAYSRLRTKFTARMRIMPPCSQLPK